MDQLQYLERVEDRLRALLATAGFANERAQVRAKNLLTRLSPQAVGEIGFTFSEERVWSYANYLLSASLRVITSLQETPPQAASALRAAAEIFEHLSAFATLVDRSRLRLLSAVAYYLAGYQANAICMVRNLCSQVEAWGESAVSPIPSLYDALAAFLERDLGRLVQVVEVGRTRILAAEDLVLDNLAGPGHADFGDALSLAGTGLVLESLFLSARYSSTGEEDSFTASLTAVADARDCFFLTGDVALANLATSLLGILYSLHSRSTWRIIYSRRDPSPVWERYLRTLARSKPSTSEFWPSQIRAINAGVIDVPGTSHVIRMPTSAGKTRVAELAILGALEANPSKKCVYIAPFRALCDEVHRSLSSTIGKAGFRVTATLGSYDTDEFRSFLEERCRVLVGTPEKVDLLFRTRPDFFAGVSLIVVDEGHIVGDPSRGPRTELLLTRLKRKLRDSGIRFLFASAVMPNPEDFAIWLCNSEGSVISTKWRPARQRLAKFTWSKGVGRIDYVTEPGGQEEFVPRLIEAREMTDYTPIRRQTRQVLFPRPSHKGETAAELALRLCREGPVLVFCAQTPSVRATGSALLKGLRLYSQSGVEAPQELAPVEDSESLSTAIEWLGKSHPIVPCLKRRIGMHYRRLPESVKQAVEDDFRRGVLRILVSTNTLGQGVNLPVQYAVVHSVSRWIEGEGGETGHSERVNVRDYWNICGRAGRAGYETEGQIIHIVSTAADEVLFQQYSRADQVEPTYSALLPLLADLVSQRITSEQLLSQLDSQLLSILVEESVDASLEGLGALLASSLAGIQCRRLGRDLAPLVRSVFEAGSRIKEEVQDPELRKLFSLTGLSFRSCKMLMQQAATDWPRLDAARALSLPEQVDVAVYLGIQAAQDIGEARALASYSGDSSQLVACTLEWVHGADLPLLRARYWPDDLDAENASQFIEDVFVNALPWVLSGYIRFTGSLIAQNGGTLPPVLGYIPAMVRFGLDRIDACWARSAGAPTRQTAVVLADAFQQKRPGGNYSHFVDWFESLEEADLRAIPGVTDYQTQRILAQRA